MGRVDGIAARSWHGSRMRRCAGVMPDGNDPGAERSAEAVERDGEDS